MQVVGQAGRAARSVKKSTDRQPGLARPEQACPKAPATPSKSPRACRSALVAPRGTGGRPLVQLGPADAQPVRAARPRALARGRPQPEGAAAAGRPARGSTARPRTRSSSPTTTACCRPTTRTSATRAPQRRRRQLGPDDLVAYFCAEFGFHESLPIYSGGLGILAGDHCKAASDMRLPFVAVGLLYRQGYFTQTIDGDGNQQRDLLRLRLRRPADRSRCATPTAASCTSTSSCPGRDVRGQGVAGARRPRAALPARHRPRRRTATHDRDIAHRLYGGDRTTRIEQEIVLGVGGVRALAALGLEPTVWHINEGHAAFLVLERVRALIAARASTSPRRSRRSPPTPCSRRTRRCRPATTTSPTT